MKQTIVLSLDTWHKIYQSIAHEYPHSVLLIRSQMRKVLGFTSRRHREYVVEHTASYTEKCWKEYIVLDFYSDKKRTWFLMKYSEIITADQ
jgi:hypothetical protein